MRGRVRRPRLGHGVDAGRALVFVTEERVGQVRGRRARSGRGDCGTGRGGRRSRRLVLVAGQLELDDLELLALFLHRFLKALHFLRLHLLAALDLRLLLGVEILHLLHVLGHDGLLVGSSGGQARGVLGGLLLGGGDLRLELLLAAAARGVGALGGLLELRHALLTHGQLALRFLEPGLHLAQLGLHLLLHLRDAGLGPLRLLGQLVAVLLGCGPFLRHGRVRFLDAGVGLLHRGLHLRAHLVALVRGGAGSLGRLLERTAARGQLLLRRVELAAARGEAVGELVGLLLRLVEE